MVLPCSHLLLYACRFVCITSVAMFFFSWIDRHQKLAMLVYLQNLILRASRICNMRFAAQILCLRKSYTMACIMAWKKENDEKICVNEEICSSSLLQDCLILIRAVCSCAFLHHSDVLHSFWFLKEPPFSSPN